MALAAAAILATLLVLVIVGTIRAENGGDRVPERVLIGDVDVSGLTPAEAERAVRFRARELRSRSVTITSPDEPELNLTATRATLGARAMAGQAVEEALEPRGLGGRVLAGIGLAPARKVDLRFALSENRVERLLATVERDVNDPATDATLSLQDGKLVTTPGEPGFGLDPRRVRAALATLPDSVSVPLGPIEPAITTAEAERAKRQAARVLRGPTRVELNGRGVPVSAEVKRRAMRFVPRDRRLLVRLDPAVITETIRAAFAGRLQEPRDASFRVNGDAVRLVGSRRGRSLDGKRIALSMVRRPGAEAVPVRFVVTEPEFTTQEAKKLRITDRVATFSTGYSCCPPRVTNIQRAAAALDGTIIPAGGTFSLNDALGQRTTDKGYVAAPQIAGGKLVDAVGGGVSQVATTFFNAAFFAGFEIVSHTPHSFYISRYPAGREATISWGGPELVVRNDWAAATLVKATAGSNEITISLYSAPLGRRVETATSDRREFTEPKENVTTNPRLDPGTREVIQSAGSGGFTVDYTRVVYTGSDVKRDETFTWRYVPQNAFIEEGPPIEEKPKPGDPADGPSGPGADDPDGTSPAPRPPGNAEPEPDPLPGGP